MVKTEKDNVYLGRRDEQYASTVHVNGASLPLRLDLWGHSPDGFEWGYDGSGPAQLALAILAYELEDDKAAIRLHQAFKRDMIGSLLRGPRTSWRIRSVDIREWLEQKDGG